MKGGGKIYFPKVPKDGEKVGKGGQKRSEVPIPERVKVDAGVEELEERKRAKRQATIKLQNPNVIKEMFKSSEGILGRIWVDNQGVQ